MRAWTTWICCAGVALLGVAGCGSDPPLVLDSVPTTTTTVSTGPSTTLAGRIPSVPLVTAPTNEGPSTTEVPPSSIVNTQPTESGPLVTWNGAPRYIHGANLPWINFGRDFGGGAAGGGVSSPEVTAAADSAFAAARAAGMNVIRWWLFPGQPTQFEVDAEGLPTGLTAATYEDIDAAVALARRHDLPMTLTLFSSPTSMPSAWLTTATGRARLSSVLGELFSRYKDTPEIMTWDIVNEPEFDVWNGNASAANVRTMISSVTQAAHDATSTPVTVGGARLDGLSMLTGLGLDYYTIHWYDPMTEPAQCLACVNASDVRAQYGITEPIVVGEFYAATDRPGRFDLWHDHGYAGGLPWSLEPDRTADRFAIDMAEARAFADAIGLS